MFFNECVLKLNLSSKLVLILSVFSLKIYSSQPLNYFEMPTPETIFNRDSHLSLDGIVNILNVYEKPLFARKSNCFDATSMSLLSKIYNQIIYVEPETRKEIFSFLEGGYLSYDDTTLVVNSSLACYSYAKQLQAHFTNQLVNDVIEKIKLLQAEELIIQNLITECLDKAHSTYVKALKIHSDTNALAAVRTWMATILCVLSKTPYCAPVGIAFSVYQFVNYFKKKDGGVLFIQ
jgi:hypothetical protein